MSNQTFIKGKDSDLESTIETMYSKINAVGIELEASSKLNPISNVYSLHLHDKEYRMMFTNGKGACEKSCEASALGEYFERLSCNYFFADFYLGEAISQGDFVHYPNEKWFEDEEGDMPSGLLDEKLWEFYDPNSELEPEEIFDTNSGAGERGICALPFVRVRDDEEIYFPVNFIANLYVSNGMSAGNSQNEARVQAISEIFERYVKNRVISEAISLPLIPQEVIERFPKTREAIEALKEHGYSLRICDASLGGVYPVISVTLIHPRDASVFASFGAHPCFEVALERTVTELLQGRNIDDMNEFHEPTFNMMEVSDPENLENHFINSTGLLSYDFFKTQSDYDFVDWNTDLDTSSEFEKMSKLIHEAGFDIYIADYTHLGVYACRVLVPGMSEIYPLEDLAWSNNNEGALLREAILDLHSLDEDACEELYEDLDESTANDLQSVAEFIGVVPDKGTLWESLKVAELKAMLCLSLGDYENAQQWNNFSLQMSELSNERKLHHRCMSAVLSIVLDEKEYKDYAGALDALYGKTTLKNCVEIVNGELNFHGLNSPGLALEGFETHHKMLSRYQLVQEAKRAHS